MRTLKILSLSLLGATTLWGCSRDMDDLDGYLAEVKARPATPIEPIPPVKTYSPYTYDGLAGRDPFRSSTSEGTEAQPVEGATSSASGPRPDFERPKEYLERFELDTLEMVGTFRNEAGYWGLVRDPDGVVHRVSEGNYIGKNHGKTIRITNGEIILTELITDGTGGWLVREATIALDG